MICLQDAAAWNPIQWNDGTTSSVLAVDYWSPGFPTSYSGYTQMFLELEDGSQHGIYNYFPTATSGSYNRYYPLCQLTQ